MLSSSTAILLPDVCAGCGISGAWICDDCRTTVRKLDQATVCRRCGHPSGRGGPLCTRCVDWTGDDLRLRSVYEFSSAIRHSILRMKYSGEYARAELHGTELAALVADLGWDADVLVAVPLHRNKQRRRGYNQALKLATEMSAQLGLDVLDCVRRERDTVSQTALSGRERRENVAGAFKTTASVANLRILLVDDVATTCSTLVECAAALRNAGAAEVRAVTVATQV